MSRAAYSKRTCRCGREISAAGCAWHNHMMAHKRKGEADFKEVGFFRTANQIRDIYVEWSWLKEPAKAVLKPRVPRVSKVSA